MEPNRIIRQPEVLRLTGQSTSTLYRNIKRGTFPPQIVIGPNSVGWLLRDVVAWIESRPVADAARPRVDR